MTKAQRKRLDRLVPWEVVREVIDWGNIDEGMGSHGDFKERFYEMYDYDLSDPYNDDEF